MNEAPDKVITIGASMGGFPYFRNILRHIDPEWPVAVMFVQHIHPDHKSQLPKLLSSITDMEIIQVNRRHAIRKGCLYLPQPDKHMFVHEGEVFAVSAPKENGSRPSINTLFRSAAVHYRERVIGILLSGLLTDGTLGMKSIQECGGLTIAQHPEEADFPEMPFSALKEGYADHSLELSKENKILKDLIQRPVEADESIEVPAILRSQVEAVSNFIEPATYNSDPSIPLKSPKSDEYMLVTLLVLMQERTNMLVNLAEKEKIKGHDHMSGRYRLKAEESRELAENLRNYMNRLEKSQKSA
ncbi:MAG: chemotaxis protein CheB [Cyclobacteriaceae bacterium]